MAVISFHVANKLRQLSKENSLNSAKYVACAKIYVQAPNLDYYYERLQKLYSALRSILVRLSSEWRMEP